MTNICLSNDLPNSKVDWHVIQQLPGGELGNSSDGDDRMEPKAKTQKDP